ncbi:putative quinol monooxygenase [Persicobacter diffluens]|uniref:ABM domain-containing protein n=1 Tax=Persicobacter diffluens TaxID=981 RepID=A0AAN5AQ75_9BACT|nr:hypothetical protein PEDI_51250 [Persicobacter diffluens]
MITIIAKWQVKADALQEVLSMLPVLQAKSTAEPGNLAYQAFQDLHAPTMLWLYESYQNREALEAHKVAAHYQELVLAKILPLLEHREVKLLKPL